jgi:hypothetical protein
LERAIIAPGFSGFQFRVRGAGLQQLYLGFYFPEQLKTCFPNRRNRRPTHRGRRIFIVDARSDGQRFSVRADEKLTPFVELDRAVCAWGGFALPKRRDFSRTLRHENNDSPIKKFDEPLGFAARSVSHSARARMLCAFTESASG